MKNRYPHKVVWKGQMQLWTHDSSRVDVYFDVIGVKQNRNWLTVRVQRLIPINGDRPQPYDVVINLNNITKYYFI